MRKTIECMVRGKVDVDTEQIKWMRTIPADNIDTTQIAMESGESYYVRGKNMFEVADDFGWAGLVEYKQ